MTRLGVLTTHPIQYYTPWFAELSKQLDLTVFYAHRQDPGGQALAGFGVEFDWDIPLLEGYQYEWLTNVARKPGIANFAGCDTPEIAEKLKRHRFDALLVLGWNKKSYWQAFLACKRTGTPVFCRGDSQLLVPRAKWRTAVKYLPYRLFLPRFDKHLYVGRRNLEYLRHYGVRESQLVFSPHFVDNQFFRSRADAARANGDAERTRSKYEIPRDAFVLLYVGKFIAKKRIADAVEACIRLNRTGSQLRVHLLLVGDGPQRESIERRAEPVRDFVHFAGFRNQKELPAYYAASSALVLPSESESWGLVVNEAMACGLPAIVSEAVGCAPDLIDPGATGATFATGNVDDLVRQIISLRQRSAAQDYQPAVSRKIASYAMETATNGVRDAIETSHARQRTLPAPVRGTASASNAP